MTIFSIRLPQADCVGFGTYTDWEVGEIRIKWKLNQNLTPFPPNMKRCTFDSQITRAWFEPNSKGTDLPESVSRLKEL